MKVIENKATEYQGINIPFLPKKMVKEFSEILNGDPIEELVLWSDDYKEITIREHFESFSKLNQELTLEWAKVMKTPLNIEKLVGLPDNAFFLKEAYIDQEGFHEKLPFVKRNKLSEIVDFPDFSILISKIESINEVIKAVKPHGFRLKNLLSFSKDGFTDELNSEIDLICQVKIHGWNEIQKFTSIVIYLNALNKVHQHVNHTFRDLNSYFLRQGFLSENGGNLLSVNLRILHEKLPSLN